MLLKSEKKEHIPLIVTSRSFSHKSKEMYLLPNVVPLVPLGCQYVQSKAKHLQMFRDTAHCTVELVKAIMVVW